MTDTPSTPPAGDPTPPTGAYGAPAGDTAGYPAAEILPEQKRGPGRGVVIGVGAAVLAVVAGAAVYATTALSGGGRQPDELAPKSTFAYAKVDLDPAANQKLAAREFFGKFPKLKKPGEDGNVFDALLAQMFEGEENFTYEADVKPWFDKRAAVAGFRGKDGASVVGILRSKDDGKAKRAMDKAVAEAKKDGDEFAYKIEKGYVVVGETVADVDDALAQSSKESIKDNETFQKDLDRLDGDQVVVMWVDVRQAFDAVKAGVPQAGLLPNAITDQIKGRVVTGLHMDGDYAEVTGYMIGMEQSGQKPPAANEPVLLKSLPANTVAAVSANGLGDALKGQLGQLGALGMDPQQFIGPMLQQLGLSLDGDILPLLGDQTVVALGGVPSGFGDISAGLLSTVKDPAAAKESGAKIAAAVSQMGVPVQSDVAGNTFYLATSNYLSELKSGKGLGDSEKFKKAMGDTGSVASAGYVDLEALISQGAPPNEAADLKALKSAGVTVGYDKGTPFFRFRVVAL